MKQRRSYLRPGVVLVAVFVLVGAHRAQAVTSVESGWWTTSPLALGPDVGEDEMLVQGGLSDPLAYAGVSFVLTEDERPQTLRLAVAPGSASTPDSTLHLCPLSAPATAAAGEPATDGPGFDCTATTTEASPSADGTVYEFDLTAFAVGSSFDLAVLPSQSSDRVVLERPTVDAVEVETGTGLVPADHGPMPPVSSPSSSAGGGSDGGGSSSFSADAGGPSLSVPSASTPNLPEPTSSTTTSEPAEAVASQPELTAPALSESVPAASEGEAPNDFLPFAFVGLVGVAAALWTVVGRQPADHVVEPAGSP